MGSLVRRMAAAAVAVAVSGCSAGYIGQTYSLLAPQRITLSCRDTYEVFDRIDANLALVTVSPIVEASASICSSGDAALPRPARIGRVLELYFERTDRVGCTVRAVRELSPIHYEVSYRCA